jgi:4-oxalocrotonate tautomerase
MEKRMPLVQISLVTGKSAKYIQSVADGVHKALCLSWGIPKNDRFQMITEHKKEHLFIDKTIWDGNRSDDVIVFYITSSPRTLEMKKEFYKQLVEVLADDPGVRQEDVFVSIVNNERENWSFGKGVAQLI